MTRAGHKCLGAVMSVHVNCECGWVSENWSGRGARKNAYSEWRTHIENVCLHAKGMR